MKNKKLLVGLCTSAAVFGTAAGVAGVVFGVKSKPITPQNQGDYSLQFDAGNGRFVDSALANQKVYHGQTFDQIDKPEVASNVGNLTFSGWVDTETKQHINGNQPISKNMKLSASYDATVGDFCTVSFVTSNPAVRIVGNATVAVKKGYLFFMINRPTAKANSMYFKGWKYAEDVRDPDDQTKILHYAGEEVVENHKIVTSMKLMPNMVQAVTVTWDPNTEDGGYISRGANYTTLETNTPFDSFNQPQLGNTKQAYFQYWADRNGLPIDATTRVTENMTVYAVWGAPTPVAGWTMLNFKQPEDISGYDPQPQDIQYSPSATATVKHDGLGTRWDKIVKPSVTSKSLNWKQVTETVTDPTLTDPDPEKNKITEQVWYIKTTSTATPVRLHSWDLIGYKTGTVPTGVNTYDLESCIVFPIMKSSITDVILNGDDQVLPEVSNKYTPSVLGGKSQECDFELYDDDPDNGGQLIDPDTGIASINEEGYLTVKSITEETSVWIKAISKINIAKYAKKQVQIIMPYNWQDNGYNQKVWYHRTSGVENPQWCYLDPAQLCLNDKGVATYTATRLIDGTTYDVNKIGTGSFIYDAYLGSAFKRVPDQFMMDFTDFNGNLIIPSDCVEIGDAVLENCTYFNKRINLDNVTTIGSHFLYNCKRFNNSNTSETTTPITFTMPKVKSIGNDFLGFCESFNTTITIPSTCKTIGNSFLYACKTFNKDITLPSTLTSFGAFFMTDCQNFTSKITVECLPTAFAKNIHDFSSSILGVSTENPDGSYSTVETPIASEGFTVAGTYAEQFTAQYPTTRNYYAYRKIKDATDPRTDVGETAYDEAMDAIFAAAPNYEVSTMVEVAQAEAAEANASTQSVIEAQTVEIKGTNDTGLPSGVKLQSRSFYNDHWYYTENTKISSVNFEISKVYNAETGRFAQYRAAQNTYYGQYMKTLSTYNTYAPNPVATGLGFRKYPGPTLWDNTSKMYVFVNDAKTYKTTIKFDANNKWISEIKTYRSTDSGTTWNLDRPIYFDKFNQITMPAYELDDSLTDWQLGQDLYKATSGDKTFLYPYNPHASYIGVLQGPSNTLNYGAWCKLGNMISGSSIQNLQNMRLSYYKVSPYDSATLSKPVVGNAYLYGNILLYTPGATIVDDQYQILSFNDREGPIDWARSDITITLNSNTMVFVNFMAYKYDDVMPDENYKPTFGLEFTCGE